MVFSVLKFLQLVFERSEEKGKGKREVQAFI